VDVGGSPYADHMSARTEAILASVLTIGVSVLAAIWMALIGAWGPAVFTVVLAAIVVWLLIVAEVRRSSRHADGEQHHGHEWSPS
jgi:uncharacterized membrane protein